MFFKVLRGNNVLFASLGLLATQLPIVPVFAQTPAARQQQQILQQQQQRERAQERQLRNEAPPTSGGGGASDPGLGGAARGRCIKIREIVIEGAPLLPADEHERTRKKSRGKCLSLLELNDILRDVTNWYVDAGYVTTRAYLPEQSLGDGTLDVKVVEGRVAGVAINENGAPRGGGTTALPGLTGERLNIRDVEQGLDQISRLQSFNPKVRLEPGKSDGQTDVVIDTQRRRSWRASATLDNFGVTSTGRYLVGATAEVDDLLGLYDFLSVSASSSDANQQFFSPADRFSQSFSAYYAVPLGYWTASVSSTAFDYETPIIAQAQVLSSSGETFHHRAELQRVIHRDQVSKTSVAANLASKTVRNYIDDNELEVSSYRLATGGLRLLHVRSQWGGVLNLSGTVDRGLPILGARRDRNIPDDAPHAQFTKGTLEASFVRPFDLLGQSFLASTSIVASASPDTLYSTEQLSAGGRYTVRGFLEDSISGEVGLYTRNELVWSLPSTGSAELTRLLGQVDLFVAYDAGWIKSDPKDPFEGGRVQGIAGGARFSRGALFGELTAEHALDAPSFIDPDTIILGFRAGVTTDGF